MTVAVSHEAGCCGQVVLVVAVDASGFGHESLRAARALSEARRVAHSAGGKQEISVTADGGRVQARFAM